MFIPRHKDGIKRWGSDLLRKASVNRSSGKRVRFSEEDYSFASWEEILLLKIDDATCHRSAQSCEGGPHKVVPNVKPFLRQVLFGV